MMGNRQRTVGLIAFLKGSSNPKEMMPGCANYDHHSGGCLLAETCFVQKDRRCHYFEEVVLPTAADIGQLELVRSLYERHVGVAETEPDTNRIRRCPGTDRHGCGAVLPPRKRYCDKCRDERRRDTYRKGRQ